MIILLFSKRIRIKSKGKPNNQTTPVTLCSLNRATRWGTVPEHQESTHSITPVSAGHRETPNWPVKALGMSLHSLWPDTGLFVSAGTYIPMKPWCDFNDVQKLRLENGEESWWREISQDRPNSIHVWQRALPCYHFSPRPPTMWYSVRFNYIKWFQNFGVGQIKRWEFSFSISKQEFKSSGGHPSSVSHNQQAKCKRMYLITWPIKASDPRGKNTLNFNKHSIITNKPKHLITKWLFIVSKIT